MSLIVWITVYNFSKLQRVQTSRLAAHYWLFDIKLSLAKRIYIKFISERRPWLRVRDPSSIRRSLSADSHRVLQLYAGCNLFHWLNVYAPNNFGQVVMQQMP